MNPRRKQTPITIRSDRAAERLKLLTRYGQSQAEVIEYALEQMPLPRPATVSPEEEERRARIEAILDRFAAARGPGMAEFDATEYDATGNPR